MPQRRVMGAAWLYSRFVTPLIGLTWIIVVTRVLLDRKAVSRTAW